MKLAILFGESAATEVVKGYKAKALTQDSAIKQAMSAQVLLGITPRTVGQWLRDINI